jgi:RNA polymerase sigma-70 factor, ECF subfamily
MVPNGEIQPESSFGQMADADLMLRVQWGGETAFAEIYRRYNRRLLDFFYGLSRDSLMAEDLCHETFLRLWRLRTRYTASGADASAPAAPATAASAAFPAYVFAIARHIWLEQVRSLQKQWRLGKLDAERDISELPLPSLTLGPGETASRSEIRAQIFSALNRLPEEQRMAFILRTVNGLSLEEIAAVMECPINTVRSRRLLAIRRLRELLHGLFVL